MIQEIIILLNTGEDGLLTVNHMPNHNKQDFTYGTTHHKRKSQSKNTKPGCISRDMARRSQTDLSSDAFVFNMKNHDLMQKWIWEKATLTWAKEIARQMKHLRLPHNTSAEMTKLTFTSHSTNETTYHHPEVNTKDRNGNITV